MQLLFYLCSVKMDFVDVDPNVLLTAHWILIDLRKMTLTAQLHLQRYKRVPDNNFQVANIGP